MASPNKDMKTGSYSQSFEGGVGGYAPYEMKGHELPGIKQRGGMPYTAGDPLNAEMEDGVSKKSGTLYTEGGVGSSPNKILGGAWSFLKDRFKKKKSGKAKTDALAAAAAAGEAAGGAVAPHGDEAHTGGSAGQVAKQQPAGVGGDPLVVGGGGGIAGAVQAAQAGAGTQVGTQAPGEEEEIVKQQAQNAMDPFSTGGKAFNPMSDIRAKEKIERTGKSPSGIPIYEFNYIGGSNRYSGAMAQDLLDMNIDAVSLGDDGYYRVNYNNIDVDMRQIN